MTDDPERAARAALRARLGPGARYEAETAPAEELLLARRGAAFFARLLTALPDAALAQPAREGHGSRAHVVAAISLQARLVAIALKGLREGLTEEEAEWRPDIALAVTLPARALRSLYSHSDVHLNVEFRDLRAEDWEREIEIDGIGSVAVRALPMLRARDLWTGALALNAGARAEDLPPALRG